MTNDSALVVRSTNLALPNASLPAPDEFTAMFEMSGVLAKSGILPTHIRTAEAAFAIMMRGRELGVPAMHAFNNINHINGKATTNSELMLALIYRDHGSNAIVWLETTNETARLRYQRREWDVAKEFAFTIEDANTAGLTTGNNRGTWRSYPGAMLRARAISAVARMAFPDSIGGMYTPEELGAQVVVDAEGQIVEVQQLPPDETFQQRRERTRAEPQAVERSDTAQTGPTEAQMAKLHKEAQERGWRGDQLAGRAKEICGWPLDQPGFSKKNMTVGEMSQLINAVINESPWVDPRQQAMPLDVTPDAAVEQPTRRYWQPDGTLVDISMPGNIDDDLPIITDMIEETRNAEELRRAHKFAQSVGYLGDQYVEVMLDEQRKRLNIPLKSDAAATAAK